MPAVDVRDDYRTIGTAGMCVNGFFLVICIWRLVRALHVSRCEFRDTRVQVHISLFTFACLEFIYQTTIYANGRIVAWGYMFHLVAINVNILSFCLIFTRWEKTLCLTGLRNRVDYLTKFLLLINLCITIPAMVVIHIRGAREKYWEILFTEAIVESCSLLFTSVWLFTYSIKLRERIARVVNNSTASLMKRPNQGSVKRIIYVLFICSCTYLGRIFCLGLISYDLIAGTRKSERFSDFGWFLLSNWIPTLIPGLLFLYTSRIVKPAARSKTLQDVFSCEMNAEEGSVASEEIANSSNRMYSNDRTISTESFSGEMCRLQQVSSSSTAALAFPKNREPSDEE